MSTENDCYSGDRYSGNDGYSGLNPPDDAILFTVSGITAIADKKFGDFDKNDDFSGRARVGRLEISIKKVR